MKKLRIIIILFLIVAISQIVIPLKMIYGQESILKTGKAYKFLTQPVDPNDPFRGKYINLNYQIDSYYSEHRIEYGKNIYVYLKDSLGFAAIDTVSVTKLATEKEYVKAKTNWYNEKDKLVYFDLPFKRYYMEESKAKPAENLVIENRNLTTNTHTTYALVYVKEGKFILENVFIDDIPIKDLVEKE